MYIYIYTYIYIYLHTYVFIDIAKRAAWFRLAAVTAVPGSAVKRSTGLTHTMTENTPRVNPLVT